MLQAIATAARVHILSPHQKRGVYVLTLVPVFLEECEGVAPHAVDASALQRNHSIQGVMHITSIFDIRQMHRHAVTSRWVHQVNKLLGPPGRVPRSSTRKGRRIPSWASGRRSSEQGGGSVAEVGMQQWTGVYEL
ncbi:hypothetical protein B0H13DRAFT_1850489 [Mycena leptocephala]|nr:hypothetical protein B0H13DRAFT_1850489 [Mycena leptocephala]